MSAPAHSLPHTPREVYNAYRAWGWEEVRTTGSHVTMRHSPSGTSATIKAPGTAGTIHKKAIEPALRVHRVSTRDFMVGPKKAKKAAARKAPKPAELPAPEVQDIGRMNGVIVDGPTVTAMKRMVDPDICVKWPWCALGVGHSGLCRDVTGRTEQQIRELQSEPEETTMQEATVADEHPRPISARDIEALGIPIPLIDPVEHPAKDADMKMASALAKAMNDLRKAEEKGAGRGKTTYHGEPNANARLLAWLRETGPVTNGDIIGKIADAIGVDRRNVLRPIRRLVGLGLIGSTSDKGRLTAVWPAGDVTVKRAEPTPPTPEAELIVRRREEAVRKAELKIEPAPEPVESEPTAAKQALPSGDDLGALIDMVLDGYTLKRPATVADYERSTAAIEAWKAATLDLVRQLADLEAAR